MAVAPYGSWKSPITSNLIVSSTISLGAAVAVDGDDVYWLEGRPLEGGRQVLVRYRPDGTREDVTPPPYNVRSRVHEYGGGAYAVNGGVVFFTNFADQLLYRMRQGAAPEPLTTTAGMRHADFDVDPSRGLIFCVREDHTREGREAENTIVSIDIDSGEETVVASGHDFFSTPRLSPNGTQLCWLAWDHPNMPWDGSELWVATLDEAGSPRDARKLAGGKSESIFQPEWSPAGGLYFVSDRTGWWNLYRFDEEGTAEIVIARDAEFGQPQWSFDSRGYAFLEDGRILASFSEGGSSRLASDRP